MRKTTLSRKTRETDILIDLTLDGKGYTKIDTGIGFFDHMLTHIGHHSLADLEVKATGDIHIDCHHLVEDVGIVLGKAYSEAVGDKKGISRYGHAIVPMDEALVLCAVDLSGRAYSDVDTPFRAQMIGSFDTQMVEEFFRAISDHAKMNLHIQVLRGKNDHHIIEGMCKAFGRAMRMAVSKDNRIEGVASTKGMLEV